MSPRVSARPRVIRSKFGAVPTMVDGIRFASKKEARRYGELKLLERTGEIRKLRRQPRYALCSLVIEGADVRDLHAGTPTPRRRVVCEYVADFEFEERRDGHPEGWRVVVEDAKGMRTDVYRLKSKWFEAQYGVTIREV